MPAYDVAHIREQGQNMIIVPLDEQFEYRSPSVRAAIVNELQLRARGARLAGHVVAIWQAGGSTKFIAPPQWHAFFRGLSFDDVLVSLNKQLSW